MAPNCTFYKHRNNHFPTENKFVTILIYQYPFSFLFWIVCLNFKEKILLNLILSLFKVQTN